MPVQTTYPGVYVEERPSGSRAISGVSTSVTAFVGTTRMGPTDTPVRLTSMAAYVRAFGAPWDETHPTGHAVGHFFANGGTEAVVVRVAPNGATAANATLNRADGTTEALKLTALGEGAWANRIGATGLDATVSYADSANPADLFTLVLTLRGTDPRTGGGIVLAQERYPNLSTAPTSPRYVGRHLGGSRLAKVTVPTSTSADKGTSTGKAGLPDKVTFATVRPTLRVSVDGGAAADLVLFPASATAPEKTPAEVATEIGKKATAAGLSVLSASVNAEKAMVLTSSTTGPASAVTVLPAAGADASQVLGLGAAWGGKESSGAAALRPAETPTLAVGFTGGADGGTAGAAGPGDVVPASGTGGVYALSALLFPRFNLLALPDLAAQDSDLAALGTALDYCRRERAFLLVDTPTGWPTDPPAVGGLRAQGAHGALYYPRLRQVEQTSGGVTVELSLPACGAVAGVYARIDATRGLWKAPAGLEAGIVGVSGLSANTDDVVSGRLNPRGVNVLRAFPAAGVVAWGARTLAGDDASGAEHKYVSVRRLTDHIATSLQLGTQFAVFEPNDPDLWAQVRLAVGSFMRGLFRQGAFQQSAKRSEADSFFVVCDASNNPQSEIDLGRVNVLVGFAPLKPAEFVVVTITQLSTLED